MVVNLDLKRLSILNQLINWLIILSQNYSFKFKDKIPTIFQPEKGDIVFDWKQLKKGDRIRVLADETQRKDFKVLTLGEFMMPGFIPIKKEHTTLKEVVDKAGGFKNRPKDIDGFLSNIILDKYYVRKSNHDRLNYKCIL